MSYVIDFIKSIFPDSSSAAIAIIFIILVFWMYKELRNNYLENSKTNQQRIDKALDIYSELELEIFKYFSERADLFSVTEKMSKASSLLPYDLLKKCITFKETTEEALKDELLLEFHNEVKNEIYRLKLKQIDSVTYRSDKNIMSGIDFYVKTKIAPFGIPLVYTYFNFVILLLLILLTALLVSVPTIKQQVLIFSLFFSAVSYTMVFYLIIGEGFVKRRFKNSIENWILFVAFVIGLPLIVLFTGFWFRGIIVLIIILVYGFYAGQKCMKDQ
ncbi:hypothetical protein E2R60_12140 [Paenibacillus dendritiformis]|uniref:hypothetical protein n=1 Tax=Paenibacillus dendritiformis TaxID=130049 RepID=UPI00105A4B9B|nr:hypothetical protein [Paenibacillus dendritiformis]TDL53795.1 hypothetical protein E2R60_12140 [Paenibacillus dendritiformis]